jgi:hypothetical protein
VAKTAVFPSMMVVVMVVMVFERRGRARDEHDRYEARRQ